MTGTLFYYPRLRAFNSSGLPVPGARLYVYRAGTTDLALTYTTSTVGALGTPHENPQISDASGEFRAVYLDPDAGHDFTFVCQTPEGAQLWAEPNVPATAGGSGGTGTTGGDGLSVVELSIYQRAAAQPITPSGGSYDFSSLTLTPPSGWSVSVPNDSSEPVWISLSVAAAGGIYGTDDTLAWTVPSVLAQDGSSVDIIFKREATQPATPAPSSSTPATWYTDVDSVPVTTDLLWSSVGTRDNASRNWIWQLPIQVEGSEGPAGPGSTLYYVSPKSGTAIKNGTGTLEVQARQLFGGNDVALTTGSVKLYVGSTLVTVANGYAAGSDGYRGFFDSGDISGSVTVELKDGPAGNVFDTITLVDVIDGTTGGPGVDGVYGYVEADGPLAWTRASDGTTWTPAGTTLDFDCTFVQAGADVARVGWRLTRDTNGLITGATTTHALGDLNSGRVTVTELSEGTQTMTVKFTYSYVGDVCVVAEGALTSMAGVGGAGPTGPAGTSGLVLSLSKRTMAIWAYQNGAAVSGAFADASGQCTVYEGSTNRTATATYVGTAVGCTGTVDAAGAYSITAMSAANTATFSIAATYGGVTVTEVVTLTKIYAGYEIVGSLPGSNNFVGRMVFLTTDSKLYRYHATLGWTRAVDGADLIANSVTTNALFAGAVTAAKISVTQLSALTADMGALTSGTIALASSGHIRAGQTAYNTGTGFFLGFDAGIPKFSIGNPAGNYLRWTGTALEINGTFSAFSASIPSGVLTVSVGNGTQVYGTRTMSVSGGKAPLTYQWSIANQDRDNTTAGNIYLTGSLASAIVGISGTATNNVLFADVVCLVTDGDGRSTTSTFSVVATHGSPL